MASTVPVTGLCMCVCSITCAWGSRIIIMQLLMHTMQQTHMHKAVTGRVLAKKLLSRRRQSDYSNMAFFYNDKKWTPTTAKKWRKVDLKIWKSYKVEAVDLSFSNYTFEIMIFVNKWHFRKFRGNLTFSLLTVQLKFESKSLYAHYVIYNYECAYLIQTTLSAEWIFS